MGVECSGSYVRFRVRGGKPAQDYGKLPLTFETNAGQTDGRVKYISRGAGYTLFLTAENEAVVSLARTTSKGDRQTAAVRMSLLGSKRARHSCSRAQIEHKQLLSRS